MSAWNNGLMHGALSKLAFRQLPRDSLLILQSPGICITNHFGKVLSSCNDNRLVATLNLDRRHLNGYFHLTNGYSFLKARRVLVTMQLPQSLLELVVTQSSFTEILSPVTINRLLGKGLLTSVDRASDVDSWSVDGCAVGAKVEWKLVSHFFGRDKTV